MIDWNKPLRTNVNHYKVTAGPHPSGNRMVCGWYNNAGEWSEGVFDKFTGATVYTEFAGKTHAGQVTIENVPEEPNDHLHLYKSGDQWFINGAGSAGPNQVAPKQLQPKSYWEKAGPGVIVKVPV